MSSVSSSSDKAAQALHNRFDDALKTRIFQHGKDPSETCIALEVTTAAAASTYSLGKLNIDVFSLFPLSLHLFREVSLVNV